MFLILKYLVNCSATLDDHPEMHPSSEYQMVCFILRVQSEDSQIERGRSAMQLLCHVADWLILIFLEFDWLRKIIKFS